MDCFARLFIVLIAITIMQITKINTAISHETNDVNY